MTEESLLKLQAKIAKEDLWDYYKSHNIVDTAKHFKISQSYASALIKSYNLVKSKDEIKATKEQTCLEKFGVKNPFQKLENIRIGDRNPSRNPKVIEKIKATKIANNSYMTAVEKGKQTRIKNAGSLEESYRLGIDKQKQTLIDRYGSLEAAHAVQKESRLETFMTIYGVDNPFKSEHIKSKIRNTNLDKYGFEYANQSKSVIDKIKISKYSKFDSIDDYNKHITNKAKRTKLDKYGDANYTNQAKAKQTLLDKYGVEYSFQIPEVRSKIAKSVKCSKLEKRFEEFLINNNFDYSKQFYIKRDNLSHTFDFAIYKDNQLKILVDCDGLYFHGYLSDETGKSVNTYVDNYRSILVPDEIKFLICLEGTEQDCYNELFKIFELDYQTYLDDIYNWCREIDFPYPNYSDTVLDTSYKSLLKADCSKFSMRARFGDKIINHFHKSIWHANKKNYLSPYEAWKTDSILKTAIKYRVIYKGNQLDPSKVLAGFSASKIAPKVSVFNPYLAKYLVNKYLNEFDTIFDPCSGFSGRMLGTCSLGKYYIGQDINSTTIDESNKLIAHFNLNANLKIKDSLIDYGEYDCLFTCTPYSDKEVWNMELINLSCDKWIDKITSNFKCKKYLFVVDSTERYKNNIVEVLENKSHLNTSREYVILI